MGKSDTGAGPMVDGDRPDSPRLLLNATETARLLGIGRTTVFDMIARHHLPAIRLGRLVRIPRPALERWIDEHTDNVA
jgi:excisionase family DNA binding protein